MKAGIHKDRYGKLSPRLLVYRDILEYNDIETEFVDINDLEFWENLKNLDVFIYRFSLYDDQKQIAKNIIPVIEKNYDIKIFPNESSVWSYDDKIKQYYQLKSKNFPIIDSWVFYDKKKALEWLANAEFPLVFKLTGGSRSQNVVLVNNYKQAKKLVRLMFGKGILTDSVRVPGSTFYKDITVKNYIHEFACKVKRFVMDEDLSSYWSVNKNYCLFQKFLPNNNYDTRITIIGNRAFGFRRGIRENDFRASGSGNLVYSRDLVDLDMVKIAFDISESFNYQSMAYDFIYDENKIPKICEISYTYSDHAMSELPGYWDENLNWHDTNICPQYFHLVDLLKIPDLKVPEHLLPVNLTKV